MLLEFWTNPINQLASMGKKLGIGAGVKGRLMVAVFHLRARAGVWVESVAAYPFHIPTKHVES